MKYVGFTGKNITAHQFEILGAKVDDLGSVSGLLIVEPYAASIQYDSYDESRYRPYLSLDSRILGGKCFIDKSPVEFRYSEDDALNRTLRFDFTDAELAVLVSKGLYNPEFEIPSLFLDTEFEIPMDMSILKVELGETSVIYSSFDMVSDLQTTTENSGYDIPAYFDEQSKAYERNQENEYIEATEIETIVNEVEEQVDIDVTEEQVDNEQTSVKDKLEDALGQQTQTSDIFKIEEERVYDELENLTIAAIHKESAERHGDDKSKAPKEPIMVHSGIRKSVDETEMTVPDAASEFDKGKADTETMMEQVSYSPDTSANDNGYEHE